MMKELMISYGCRCSPKLPLPTMLVLKPAIFYLKKPSNHPILSGSLPFFNFFFRFYDSSLSPNHSLSPVEHPSTPPSLNSSSSSNQSSSSSSEVEQGKKKKKKWRWSKATYQNLLRPPLHPPSINKKASSKALVPSFFFFFFFFLLSSGLSVPSQLTHLPLPTHWRELTCQTRLECELLV